MFVLGLFMGVVITSMVAYKIHKKIIENIKPEEIITPIFIERTKRS